MLSSESIDARLGGRCSSGIRVRACEFLTKGAGTFCSTSVAMVKYEMMCDGRGRVWSIGHPSLSSYRFEGEREGGKEGGNEGRREGMREGGREGGTE